ncbi:RNA-directed DNA polymerase (Reverse transcriptase) [Trifolium medium]|uniref:RNA-directed DNA polymerase (Reverse transcriptase) n=1 Tax=Trifolium medium TaxID=97028 RepID=A0A392MYB6_9FABA|nr:RNA-directed DNA polymerase (Reverse transcriptase) [Trifolium medium]
MGITQLFCISLWLIWKHSNQKVFNQTAFDTIVFSKKASLFVEEFNSANPPRMSSPVCAVPKWSLPPIGLFKINVDAGCFKDGTTGWGLVVRNSAGLVLFAETKIDEVLVSPLLAECMGLRWTRGALLGIWINNSSILQLKLMLKQLLKDNMVHL